MKQGWSEIIPIWVVVAIATVGITFLDRQVALVWAGAILAGSLAVVSLIHLFKEDVDGFVRLVPNAFNRVALSTAHLSNQAR